MTSLKLSKANHAVKILVQVDGEIIGQVSTRHKLNEYLSNFDGHIGYAIAAEFRGRGYTKQIL